MIGCVDLHDFLLFPRLFVLDHFLVDLDNQAVDLGWIFQVRARGQGDLAGDAAMAKTLGFGNDQEFFLGVFLGGARGQVEGQENRTGPKGNSAPFRAAAQCLATPSIQGS